MHTLLGRVLLGGRLRLVASPDGCWCYDLLARHMTVDASRTQERMSALPARLRASPGTFCTAAGERLLVPANPVLLGATVAQASLRTCHIINPRRVHLRCISLLYNTDTRPFSA